MYENLTDENLVAQIQEGHSGLFRIIVERYKEKVFHTALGFLHNRQDAEDLVQDVFVRAYLSLYTFEHRSAFSTWLYRITINAALNTLRKKSKWLFIEMLPMTKQQPDLLGTNIENIEEQIISEETSNLLSKALHSLPEKQRSAVVLSYYNELSQKEIAEILDTTEGAVESLLQRAKANLRKKLGVYRRKNKE